MVSSSSPFFAVISYSVSRLGLAGALGSAGLRGIYWVSLFGLSGAVRFALMSLVILDRSITVKLPIPAPSTFTSSANALCNRIVLYVTLMADHGLEGSAITLHSV